MTSFFSHFRTFLSAQQKLLESPNIKVQTVRLTISLPKVVTLCLPPHCTKLPHTYPSRDCNLVMPNCYHRVLQIVGRAENIDLFALAPWRWCKKSYDYRNAIHLKSGEKHTHNKSKSYSSQARIFCIYMGNLDLTTRQDLQMLFLHIFVFATQFSLTSRDHRTNTFPFNFFPSRLHRLPVFLSARLQGLKDMWSPCTNK